MTNTNATRTTEPGTMDVSQLTFGVEIENDTWIKQTSREAGAESQGSQKGS